MKALRFSRLFAAALLLSSCGSPSYPKEQVAESLVRLCRDEYHIDVQAQMKGTTLGVLAPIPGLVDALRRSSGSSAMHLPAVLVEGHYAEGNFNFRVFSKGEFTRVPKRDDTDRPPREPEPPVKKLQQVSTALSRVALSTNAPVEFFQLIARDPGSEGLDVLYSGHLMDSKRVWSSDISISEIHSRSQFGLRLQPEGLARQTVAAFLQDLRRIPLPKLLSAYTAPSVRFGELLPKILLAAVDLKGLERRLIESETQWPVRQIDRSTLLVDVPLAPMGEPGALLFSIEVRENSASLLNIERLPDGKLPPSRESLGPPARWGEGFYLEPLSLPEFLTEQISRRVMAEFEPLDLETKKKRPEPATLQDVARTLVETTAYVTQSYEFKQFQKISVVDALKGTQWLVRAVELPLYRRRDAPELKPVP